MSSFRAKAYVGCALFAFSAAATWWCTRQQSDAEESSSEGPSASPGAKSEGAFTAPKDVVADMARPSRAKNDLKSHPLLFDDAGDLASASTTRPASADNKKAHLSVETATDDGIRASYARDAPVSTFSSSSPSSPAGMPSPAATEEVAVDITPLDRALVVYQGPIARYASPLQVEGPASPAASAPALASTSTPSPTSSTMSSSSSDLTRGPVFVPETDLALVLTTPRAPTSFPASAPAHAHRPSVLLPTPASAPAREPSLYTLFGEGEDLLENCSLLLNNLREFQAEMLRSHEEIAAFCSNNNNWAAADTGPKILDFCQINPESCALFYDAINLWVKCYECIAHAVFVLITHEIPLSLAAGAAMLGAEARNLQSLCLQWQWVGTSRMMTFLQRLRVQVAFSYRTRKVRDETAGDKPQVLLVPYMDVVHDPRMRRRDVLVGLIHEERFRPAQFLHLLPEIEEAVAARSAEQRFEAEMAAATQAAFEAERMQQAQRDVWAELARRQAQAESDAALRKKEEEEMGGSFYDDLLA